MISEFSEDTHLYGDLLIHVWRMLVRTQPTKESAQAHNIMIMIATQ